MKQEMLQLILKVLPEGGQVDRNILQQIKGKEKQDKANPRQALRVPGGCGRFQDNRHMKVVRLSAPRTGRLYIPGYIRGYHFCLRLSQPQDRSAAGTIMSMKNSNNTVGNRTRDHPACSAVPQPTAPPPPGAPNE